MKSLCIKTNNSNLLSYLLSELKTLELNDVCFSENYFKYYKNIIVHYTGNQPDLFFDKISSILSLLVIDEVEENLLKRLLIQNYFYFDAVERNKILGICFDILAENFSNLFDKKFQVLYKYFYTYISSHKQLVLDGFINFRLKDYMDILDDIVGEAVNSFLVEKEYAEFISLLKLYINSQKSNCELVHLVYSSTHSILLDENKEIIHPSDEMFKAKYLSDISFSSNDYTLNSLLSLLPKNIYLHISDYTTDEFIHTLQLVFEDRIHLCTNCSICKMYHSTSLSSP